MPLQPLLSCYFKCHEYKRLSPRDQCNNSWWFVVPLRKPVILYEGLYIRASANFSKMDVSPVIPIGSPTISLPPATGALNDVGLMSNLWAHRSCAFINWKSIVGQLAERAVCYGCGVEGIILRDGTFMNQFQIKSFLHRFKNFRRFLFLCGLKGNLTGALERPHMSTVHLPPSVIDVRVNVSL